MPILPPNPQSPYDTVETVLNFARVIANDAEVSIDGDLLANTQPETLPFLNLAWREFQDMLVDNGVENRIEEIILTNFSPCFANDPSAQPYIGYTESWDGTGFQKEPLLPGDMIEPLRLWQRQTGTDSAFVPMNPANDGLYSSFQYSYQQLWDWRNDRIYLNGANVFIDFRCRYSAYFNDFALNPDDSFPSTARVPVLRSAQALAYLLVGTFAGGRGSDYYAALLAKSEKCMAPLFNRTARKKQRVNHRRRPYGSGSRSCLYGW